MSSDPNSSEQNRDNNSNGGSASGSPIQSHPESPQMTPQDPNPQQAFVQQEYPPQGYQQAPHQGYQQGHYPQGPPQGYPPQSFTGYPPQEFAQQGYPPQGLAPQGYPPQGFASQAPQGYPPQGYPPQGFASQAPQGYPPQGFAPQAPQGYPPQGFAPQAPQGYPPQGFAPQGPQGYPPQGPYPGMQDQFYQGPPQGNFAQPQMGSYPPEFNPQFQFNGGSYYPGNAVSAPAPVETKPTSGPDFDAKFYSLTEAQLKEFKEKMQNRFRQNMPFDWIGQADVHWYSSWCLSQENFVAFRIFLSVYAYWCWQTFSNNVFDFGWTSRMEMLMDPSSLLRTGFLWLSLFSVFIGIFGSSVMSLGYLTLPENSFKRLAAYKYYSSYLGRWRNWAVFGLNYHYDAAPILACMPIIFLIVPSRLYPIKVAQSAWPAITLPLFVMMDLWIVKRCRIDSTYIRRSFFLAIFVLALGSLLWAWHYFWYVRSIFNIRSVSGILEDLAPTIITAWGFAMIATIGVDFVYNFLRFKANHLLANHFNKLSVRNVGEIVKENDEYYTEKEKKISLAFEEEQARINAEMSAYYASLSAPYEMGEIPSDPTTTEPQQQQQQSSTD